MVDGNVNVTVDGQKCGDLLSRDKILKLQNENNVALAFDDLINANQDRLRFTFSTPSSMISSSSELQYCPRRYSST